MNIRIVFVPIVIITIVLTSFFSGCIGRIPDDPNTSVESITFDGQRMGQR
jgi:hypothetical protein